MIWFDAVLETPAADDLLRRGIARMLSLPEREVDVVSDIGRIADAAVTCVVEAAASADDYSQLISLYLPEAAPQPDILESAARLAREIDRALLVANDASADPCSFIRLSRAGQPSVVLVDADELDENERYVIRHAEGGPGDFS